MGPSKLKVYYTLVITLKENLKRRGLNVNNNGIKTNLLSPLVIQCQYTKRVAHCLNKS